MIDFKTLKKLTIGGVELKQLFINSVQVWKSGCKNWVEHSINADGSIFGYQDNMRVRSSGELGGMNGVVATGFIPVKAGDIVRFNSDKWGVTKDNGNCINLGYITDGVYTSLGSYTDRPSYYGLYQSSYGPYQAGEESEGIWKQVIPPDDRITHLRMSCWGTGENLIVTVNEEIE